MQADLDSAQAGMGTLHWNARQCCRFEHERLDCTSSQASFVHTPSKKLRNLHGLELDLKPECTMLDLSISTVNNHPKHKPERSVLDLSISALSNPASTDY
eukprot:1161739-Pelagomonas_calceolata.AAC.4